MPCLLARDFADRRHPKLLGTVTPGCEWVLAGEGKATRKWDGTACLVRGGRLFKRFDAKGGRTPPPGFEATGDPDPITKHWPGWVPVDVHNPDSVDVWHALAWAWRGIGHHWEDGTYELVGPKVNGNREGFLSYHLIRHGEDVLEVPRTVDGIRAYLEASSIEGIVFWRGEDPDCDKVKIRRDDFGFEWPRKDKVLL